MRFQAELTDLFCGEANYSWVRRSEFSLPDGATDRALVTKAKAELGLTGVKCRRTDQGDDIQLRPYGSCTVAFIFPIY